MSTFGRHERLKSQTAISRLFKEGHSFLAYPLRVIWIPWENEEASAQVAFSVSKKTFKSAVRRNRVKRLMREAYRSQKVAFYEKLSAQQRGPIAVMFIFVGKELLSLSEIEAGMQKFVRKI